MEQSRPRLADFIDSNREQIMAEWVNFAQTCAPASGAMDLTELRDHASQMLTAFAKDLRQPQDSHEQSEKSKGRAAPDESPGPTAATEHGAGRAASGFTIEQMVAEYRALRASVLRLWRRARTDCLDTDLTDITRFNEAVDQALAESVTEYTLGLGRSRDRFIGILGHDLRSPLSTIYTSAKFMLETGDLTEPHVSLTTRIVSSCTRMIAMVGDLLDFTRSRLGDGIPIARTPLDLGRIAHEVVDEVRAAHPKRTLTVESRGNQKGDWDGPRVRQALTNLIVNAIEHGYTHTPIDVEVKCVDNVVAMSVHNSGQAISPELLLRLFDPMRAGATTRPKTPGANLGLGLYIVERIAVAHGGRVDVSSTDADGTTFTIMLPTVPTPPEAQ